jgi:hypothetical protein
MTDNRPQTDPTDSQETQDTESGLEYYLSSQGKPLFPRQDIAVYWADPNDAEESTWFSVTMTHTPTELEHTSGIWVDARSDTPYTEITEMLTNECLLGLYNKVEEVQEWADFRPFDDVVSVPQLLGELVGAASMCWENIEEAGVFKSEDAKRITEKALTRLREILTQSLNDALADKERTEPV